MLPLAVIVSGAPGSGKTTLASKLAARMRLPHIERDHVMHGLDRTMGEKIDRRTVSVPAYFECVASLLDNNISLVTDGTLYKGVSEAQVASYVVSRAYAINVHTRAKNEHRRFYEREMNREGHPHDWVEGHMKVLEKIYDQTVDPLDLGVPVIEVDANDEYEPSIATLVEKISHLYESRRKLSTGEDIV